MSEKKEAKSGKFLLFIAYLQVIGIILVVLGHSFHQYPDGWHGKSILIFRLIYSFHMPLFMFISGFLLYLSEFGGAKRERSFGKFTVSKIKRLLLPYCILTMLTYFPRAAMSDLADDHLPLSAKGFFEALINTDMLPIPYYWYIQALFLLSLMMFILFSLTRRIKISDLAIIIPLIILCSLLSSFNLPGKDIFAWQEAIYYGVYFLGGILYSKYFEFFSRHLPLDSCIAFLVTASCWLATFFYGLNILSAFFGIAMCICFSRILEKHDLNFLAHLVGANYLIFLLSWYFNVAFQQVLAHFTSLPWWIHTLLSLVFGIYIPWLGYELLRKHRKRKLIRHISTLLGQTFPPSKT